VLRKGSIIAKEVFLNNLYGGMDEPDLKIIDVYICKLRKKLALAGAEHMISTMWGRGYVLRETAAAREPRALRMVPGLPVNGDRRRSVGWQPNTAERKRSASIARMAAQPCAVSAA
jgi:hypothetical protein